ncbi:MAG: iron ABC transporter permease [archaeon]|nr:iron ABC transporter permease [archaeon]
MDVPTQFSHRKQEIELEKRKILKSRSTRILFMLGLLAVVIVAAGYSVTQGSTSISIITTYQILLNDIFPGTFDIQPAYTFIVNHIRGPRVLMAVFAGVILALGGALMQTLFRNPLATPYTLGISSGAGFGATLYFVFGISLIPGTYGLIANAFLCSMIPAAIIFVAATNRKVTPTTMVLGGVAISYMFSACNTLSQYFGDSDAVKDVVFWSVGDLNSVSLSQIPYAAITALLLFAFSMIVSRNLNIMRMGDDSAKSLGVNVNITRLAVVGVVCLSTAVIISFTGPIGFICLLSPHISRKLVGNDLRYLLPASAVTGATLLVFADYIAKMALDPILLPVGAITALIGAPVLIYLLFIKRANTPV